MLPGNCITWGPCTLKRTSSPRRPLLKSSLEGMQASLGPDHPDVAQVYASLAILSMKHNGYEEAESDCQYALDILGKSSPRDYPGLIKVLNIYAALL